MNSTRENLDLTPIQQFYSDAKILITGATGFFGKILLEKLLRSCPDVSTVYILVRQSKGKNSKTRTKEIMDHVLFKTLKAEQPNSVDKVIGIDSDCRLPNLGLNSQDMELLKKEVNIVFHLAATLSFIENLKTATFVNIRATRDIISLARAMPNLKVFMHMSSAYTNFIHNEIEERIYPPAIDGNTMITMAETLPNSVLEKISDVLIGEYLNTYTFTKQIAEGIVNEYGENLPVGIHRPALALPTYREPIKAWMDSLHSAPGLVTLTCLGIVKTMHCSYFAKSAVIPVDMAMNSLIAAAWDTAAVYQRVKLQGQKYEIPIYHYESNNSNSISWGHIFEKPYYSSKVYNSKATWFHYFKMHNNFYIHTAHRIVLHLIPAFFLDLIALVLGKPPIMMNMYSKIHKLIDTISSFGLREWTFKSNNIRKMIDTMSAKDRDIFFSDLCDMEWNEYCKSYMNGVTLYALKEADQIVFKEKNKCKRTYLTEWFIIITSVISMLLVLWYTKLI